MRSNFVFRRSFFREKVCALRYKAFLLRSRKSNGTRNAGSSRSGNVRDSGDGIFTRSGKVSNSREGVSLRSGKALRPVDKEQTVNGSERRPFPAKWETERKGNAALETKWQYRCSHFAPKWHSCACVRPHRLIRQHVIGQR